MNNFDYFFEPKSVAIIGASHIPGKIGYAIMENFIKGGYRGIIYPINPNISSIFNLLVYPSIKKVPEEVDLALIAVPAAIVPKVLKECIEKKVKGVIIISSGFSEIGSEGKKLEENLKKIIKGKTRVIGPNCIGVLDTTTKNDTLFLSQRRLKRPKEGNIAFISQSGAVGSTILDWLSEEGIGISKFVSYGNAMDVNETDLLEYFANDEKTKVIVVYLEGIRSEGKKFIEVAKKVTKKKPVIILKAGKTEKGMKAVVSHTGSLAGSSRIYSGVFKQTGIIEANDWEELIDFTKAFSMQPLPKDNKLLIITDGGGFGVLATDESERQGLQLEELPEKLKKSLKKELPNYVSFHNPLDLTGDATAERYKLSLENSVKYFSGFVVITLFQVPTLQETIIDILINFSKTYKKPIICCAAGGNYTKKLSKKLELNGIPTYSKPETAVKVFSTMAKYSKFLSKH